MKNTYTIMNLDMNHIDEICDDIKYQYENGIASCALFSMTLMPDGSLKEIPFVKNGEIYQLDSACNTLEPVIIFAK